MTRTQSESPCPLSPVVVPMTQTQVVASLLFKITGIIGTRGFRVEGLPQVSSVRPSNSLDDGDALYKNRLNPPACHQELVENDETDPVTWLKLGAVAV